MARDDPRSDRDLLAATPADPEAFAVLYRRHLRPVLAYLVRRTGRADLAADLAAETFAAALEGARRYDPAAGEARGWLFAIAGHKLADSARRQRVVADARTRLGMAPRELTDDDLERAPEMVDAQRMSADLEALVADLPAPQREALLARVVEERDYRQIAADLACSEAVVRQRVARGLSTLRRRLGETAA